MNADYATPVSPNQPMCPEEKIRRCWKLLSLLLMMSPTLSPSSCCWGYSKKRRRRKFRWKGRPLGPIDSWLLWPVFSFSSENRGDAWSGGGWIVWAECFTLGNYVHQQEKKLRQQAMVTWASRTEIFFLHFAAAASSAGGNGICCGDFLLQLKLKEPVDEPYAARRRHTHEHTQTTHTRGRRKKSQEPHKKTDSRHKMADDSAKLILELSRMNPFRN